MTAAELHELVRDCPELLGDLVFNGEWSVVTERNDVRTWHSVPVHSAADLILAGAVKKLVENRQVIGKDPAAAPPYFVQFIGSIVSGGGPETGDGETLPEAALAAWRKVRPK